MDHARHLGAEQRGHSGPRGAQPEVHVLPVEVNRGIKRAERKQDVARRGDAGAREPGDPGRPLEPPRLCSGEKPGGLQRARDDRSDPGPRADRRATGRRLGRTVGLQHARPGERAPLERVARELGQAAVDQLRVGVEENGRLALGGLDAAVRGGAKPERWSRAG